MTTLTLHQRIGNQLRAAREKRELTQEEVADRLSVVRSQYTHYETGFTPVSVEQLFKLAEILDKPVTYFLGIEDRATDLPPSICETIRLMQQLEGSAREDVLDYARYIAGKNTHNSP